MSRKRDVCWGFFYCPHGDPFRDLETRLTKKSAQCIHRIMKAQGWDPGTLFKITEPTRRKKQGRGK